MKEREKKVDIEHSSPVEMMNDEDLHHEARKIANRLLTKRDYFDIPPSALPEDIRVLVEKRKKGARHLTSREEKYLNQWFSSHQQEFTFGEREPIELGKYPESIRELVRKARKDEERENYEALIFRQLLLFLKGKLDDEEAAEEVFARNVLTVPELENNFSSHESLAIVADFYREILKKDSWDKGFLDALKGYLIDKYPDSVEEIQVVVGMVRHLYLQKEVEEAKEAWTFKYDPERSRNFAEYNYLFSHFFVASPPDRVYGQSLFSAMSLVSRKLDFKEGLFGMIWQGNMGQVAIYKALSSVGEKPEFSTPKEDVYFKVDLWAAKSEKEASSFQIKTSRQRKQTIVLKESEWVDFPSVRQRLKSSERHFISEEFRKVNSYSAKVKKYGKETGRDIKAYYVVIPSDSIDYFTGELAPVAVEKLRAKVNALGKDEPVGFSDKKAA